MATTWLTIIIIIPSVVFWFILKIVRIKLYAYKRKQYPDDFKHFGYNVGYGYLGDIMKNKYPKDVMYSKNIRINRIVFIVFAVVLVTTIYALFEVL